MEINFQKATDQSYKVFVIQRIHKYIWQSNRKINRYFAWQIICGCSVVLTTVLYHGLLLASKLAKGSIKWTQIPMTFTPAYTFFLLGHSCSRCIEVPKCLRTLLIEKSGMKHIKHTKLVEHFSLQLDHQEIEFHPLHFFKFNFEFVVAALSLIADYDIVFMQFYFT